MSIAGNARTRSPNCAIAPRHFSSFSFGSGFFTTFGAFLITSSRRTDNFGASPKNAPASCFQNRTNAETTAFSFNAGISSNSAKSTLNRGRSIRTAAISATRNLPLGNAIDTPRAVNIGVSAPFFAPISSGTLDSSFSRCAITTGGKTAPPLGINDASPTDNRTSSASQSTSIDDIAPENERPHFENDPESAGSNRTDAFPDFSARRYRASKLISGMLSIENGNLRPVNLCVKTPSTPISPPPAYPEISRPRNDNDTSSPLRIEISKSPTTALYLLLESVSIDFNSPFPNFDRIEMIRSRTLATSELSNLARTFPTATSTSSPPMGSSNIYVRPRRPQSPQNRSSSNRRTKTPIPFRSRTSPPCPSSAPSPFATLDLSQFAALQCTPLGLRRTMPKR